MKVEIRLFLGLFVFFIVLTPVYGFWNGWRELAGVTALLLTALMMALIAWYLHITAKHYQNRPDDDPAADIDEQAGDYGFFPPYSWWPFWLGLAAAICFAGLAVGWWLFMIGAVIAPVAIVGWTFEYFKGDYAH